MAEAAETWAPAQEDKTAASGARACWQLELASATETVLAWALVRLKLLLRTQTPPGMLLHLHQQGMPCCSIAPELSTLALQAPRVPAQGRARKAVVAVAGRLA